MTVRFLLDTNALSEPAKPKPNPRVMARFRSETGRIAMAAPVWNELIYGCERLPASKRRRNLERYLRTVLTPAIPILAYDAVAAEWHGTERARRGLLANGARHRSFRWSRSTAAVGNRVTGPTLGSHPSA